MKRVALTNRSGLWFDYDSCISFSEEKIHDGRNWISLATGSQFEHERLHLTKSGKWVLEDWSDYQGTLISFEIVSNYYAAAWFGKQGILPDELPEDVKELFIGKEI